MSEPGFEHGRPLCEDDGDSLYVFLSMDLALSTVCERSHYPACPASLTIIIRCLLWPVLTQLSGM